MRISILCIGDPASFVIGDYEILRDHHDVELLILPPKPAQFLYHLTRFMLKIRHSDVVLSWFADIHSAAAVVSTKVFGKKSIVIVGGYDVARMPELGYGIFTRSFLRKAATTIALRRADRVLAVDPSLRDKAVLHARTDGSKIEYLATGFDPEYWSPLGHKEVMVLTVAQCRTVEQAKIKGLDTFARAASNLSTVPFVAIGLQDDAMSFIRQQAPPNLKLIGSVDKDTLLSYYRRSKVYCQLSLSEGLPNALCEALLCECLAVVTEGVPGIRRAVADLGFYIPKADDKAAAAAILEVIQNSEGLGIRSRARIVELFPLEARRRALLAICKALVFERP